MSATVSSLQADLFEHAALGDLWEPEGRPEIPAAWISDLLATGVAGDRAVHPKGVQVAAVTLTGRLDLEFAALKVPLVLSDVDIGEPLNLEQAQGSSITITGSRLAEVRATQLFLKYSLDLSGTRFDGPVLLEGAQIGGKLDCSGGTFRNPGGNALSADGMQVTGDVNLGNQFEAEGEVRLLGAVIRGDLACSGGTFRNPGGDALSADRMQVTGSVFLGNHFEAEGQVRLLGAEIGGDLSCFGGTFRNARRDGGASTALDGQGLTVNGTFRWLGVGPQRELWTLGRRTSPTWPTTRRAGSSAT